MRQLARDRVGVSWRAPLAAQAFAHLDAIEVIEVIAEDYWSAGSKALSALRSLAAHRPLLVHGVSLGPVSISGMDRRRLDRLARLIHQLEPDGWSEHLSLVRAGGHEIGHLAAPPRNRRTAEAAVENLQHMQRLVGTVPALENVASLIAPPDSDLSEAAWIGAILDESRCAGLLDLHNLYANAVNLGTDPMHYLRGFGLHRVRMVHLSGGRVIEIVDPRSARKLRRVLDDHLHEPPPVVFEMLRYLGEHCAGPLDVILERDGRYPRFEELLLQLDKARAALAAGRSAASRRRQSA